MSELPPQDKKTYTEDEIEHLLARRMAAVQLDQLTDRVARNEGKASELFSEIRASLKALQDSATSGMSHLYQCRSELRDEIEAEFVTKTVFDLEMKRVETMIQSQWQKITIAVSAVVLTIQLVFRMFPGGGA
jgi:hypothetical protein